MGFPEMKGTYLHMRPYHSMQTVASVVFTVHPVGTSTSHMTAESSPKHCFHESGRGNCPLMKGTYLHLLTCHSTQTVDSVVITVHPIGTSTSHMTTESSRKHCFHERGGEKLSINETASPSSAIMNILHSTSLRSIPRPANRLLILCSSGCPLSLYFGPAFHLYSEPIEALSEVVERA